MPGETGTVPTTAVEATDMLPSSSARRAAYLYGVTALGGVLYVVWQARLLRPIADDYCAGRNAILGFVGSLANWFQTWSGDLGARAIDFIVVGWPLKALPWSLGSLIPFVTTVACIAGAVAAMLIRAASPGMLGTRRGLLIVAPVVALAWWSYWWLPVRLSSLVPSQSINETSLNLAQSITIWQIVNSSYALVPGLMLLSLVLTLRFWRGNRRISMLILAGVGVFFGMTGLVLAATTFACLAVTLLSEVLLRRRWLSGRLAATVLGAGLLAGMSIAYLAPGSQIRSEFLAQNPALSPITGASLIVWTIPRAVLEWGAGVANVGAVAVAIALAGLGFTLSRAGLRLEPKFLARAGAGLVGFSLLLSLVNRASEAVAYPAFWHQISTRTFIFIGVCLLGFACGAAMARRRSSPNTTAAGVVIPFALACVIAVASLQAMVDTIQERFDRWQAGPAPMAAITDIENAGGWEAGCWLSLSRRDDAPPRGR